jgi:hypothetical protein
MTVDIGSIQFYALAPDAPPVIPADRSALGSLPVDAYRYCEALTRASSIGYYLFAPIDFHILFDGSDFLWSSDHGESWTPVVSETLPGYDEVFDSFAPENARGFAPPFLSRLPVPGFLQIWTGYFVRTPPGWASLVRAPANFPQNRSLDQFEGLIDSDEWLSPVFTNVRVCAMDRPLYFDRLRPLVQVQPLPRAVGATSWDRKLSTVGSLAELDASDWRDFSRTVVDRATQKNQAQPGRYAVAARRRDRASLAAV